MKKNLLSVIESTLELFSMRKYETRNVKQVSLQDSLIKANNGFYNYIVIHRAGSMLENESRDKAALPLYNLNRTKNPETIFFLNGYRGETIEDVFKKDELLFEKREIYPEDKFLEVVKIAINTPANVGNLLKRKNKEKTKILYISNKNHQNRLAYVTQHYITEGMPEEIDVLGVQGPSDTFRNKLYEKFSLILTKLFFKGTEKGDDPDKLTKHYNDKRYSFLGRLFRG